MQESCRKGDSESILNESFARVVARRHVKRKQRHRGPGIELRKSRSGTPTLSQRRKATAAMALSRAVAGTRVVVDPAHAERLHAREPGDFRCARRSNWPVRKGRWPHAGHARSGGVGPRCSTDEPAEQEWETTGGGWGGKTGDQGERRAT